MKNKWLDILSVLFSAIVIYLSVKWLVSNGVVHPPAGTNLAWYLVRSSGVVAYLLLLASMVWGLLITSKFVRDWSPGIVSLTMHSTVSLLALVISLFHAGLLLFDNFLHYTVLNMVVPFTGPYRPFWVGVGVISFWLIVIISLSFPFRKYLGHKRWLWLHYTSYVAFILVSGHGAFAGTDGANTGFRFFLFVAIFVLISLYSNRAEERQIQPAPAKKSTKAASR